MTDTFIPGGYILLSRRLMESGIMQKPPIYFKIWTWLLLKAQHKDYGNLKRGQLITSIPEIQEAMSYKVGFRVEKPSKKQVWGVLDWLRNPEMENSSEILVNNLVNVTMTEPMIVTTKVTHGILVNIVKYNVYQDPKNYEGNDEGTMKVTMKEQRRERQGNNNNKNDKNVQECNKNGKEDILSSLPDDPRSRTPYSEIIDAFNHICISLPKVQAINKKRKDVMRARWKEHPDIEFFKNIFALVEQSDFLSGRNGKWTGCNFDWVIKPSNIVKIMEGTYNNKGEKPQKRIPRAFASLMELEEGGTKSNDP